MVPSVTLIPGPASLCMLCPKVSKTLVTLLRLHSSRDPHTATVTDWRAYFCSEFYSKVASFQITIMGHSTLTKYAVYCFWNIKFKYCTSWIMVGATTVFLGKHSSTWPNISGLLEISLKLQVLIFYINMCVKLSYQEYLLLLSNLVIIIWCH